MRLAGVDGLSTVFGLCVVTTALVMAVPDGAATVRSVGTPGRSKGNISCVVVPLLALVLDLGIVMVSLGRGRMGCG